MADVTIRDMVDGYERECHLSGDLHPGRASEILVALTSLLGNIGDEILRRDLAYNDKLKECYTIEAKANRAKILAETSNEYKAMREAKNVERSALELIKSLKYFLKVRENELRQQGNL